MAGQGDDRALRRIILMLLALASLAERASGACYPVRCLVLWALRPGEVAARAFVREVAQTPLRIIDRPAFPNDNSSAGALRLAMCFKALAAALQHLLCRSPRFTREIRRGDGVGAARPIARHVNEMSLVGLPGSREPPLPCPWESKRAKLQSQNGGVECFGVSGDKSERARTLRKRRSA